MLNAKQNVHVFLFKKRRRIMKTRGQRSPRKSKVHSPRPRPDSTKGKGNQESQIRLWDRQMGRNGAALLMFVMGAMMTVTTLATKLSTRECEELGFTGLALCSDCNSLAEYVKNQELVSECFKCCTQDSDDSTAKITYSGAILEVCMRNLVFYPEIVGFIEAEKDKFPNVKLQYIYNSPPKLIMLDSEGQHKETIRIDNWKREHVLHFLREKVKPPSA